MHEFDLIDRYFKPLARGFPGSLALSDDAALMDAPAGMQFVVTKDAISEGIHFIGSEEPALIARKLLRTNLSDLAAMGAEPYCYFLSISLPVNQKSELSLEDWMSSFTSGLEQDQETFAVHLAGGDTTSSRSDLTLSMTAVGLVPQGKSLRRNGAKPGDTIYVSGTLGDSALGLKLLSAHKEEEYLVTRYLLPQPRLALGMKLRTIATSCMDISDGLVQDLGHICKASGIGAIVYADQLPLSDAAKKQPEYLIAALTGGDDYELLFTTSLDLSRLDLPCPVTRIGVITDSSNVVVLDHDGSEMVLEKKGFEHF
ncbi:MAG: thiamine-phosphate kinase [Rickettsiales bacterium]|jgi:thiamine-monophosphate kinase|nr:thiamine-phosphate kinase [Rickettsiales bacterium]